MKGKFEILKDDVLETYDEYELIPESFDYLICFKPTIPEAPHTPEEHELIESFHSKFKELLKRQKNGSSN